MRVERALSQLI
jgi:hypothetical protein